MKDWSKPPNYAIARIYLNVLLLVGWIALVLGLFLLFGALSESNSIGRGGLEATLIPLAILGGANITFFGLLIIVGVQLTRASLDSAEIAWHQLALQRASMAPK